MYLLDSVEAHVKHYRVQWTCEICGCFFSTLLKCSQIDTWSVDQLPEIPSCRSCGGDRVFYWECEHVELSSLSGSSDPPDGSADR